MSPAGVALPLPMFPLGQVLFPRAHALLHVFEPRYRALARDCTRGDGKFGVVLISRGSEVGGGDERFTTGTSARIVESLKLGDGRWHLVAVGDRRIEVATWLPDDPYPLALVEEVPDLAPEPAETVGLVARAEEVVQRALALKVELAEAVPDMPRLESDPVAAGWQLAAVTPLGPLDHQRILGERDPLRRLELIESLTSDAAELFAYRLNTA